MMMLGFEWLGGVGAALPGGLGLLASSYVGGDGIGR